MAEKFAEQIGLEGLLQQSAVYLRAKAVALFLATPGARTLEFAMAIPNENAADRTWPKPRAGQQRRCAVNPATWCACIASCPARMG